MKEIVLHRYTTGKKKDIIFAVDFLDKQTKLSNFDEIMDLKDLTFKDNEKLYIEIKAVKYSL